MANKVSKEALAISRGAVVRGDAFAVSRGAGHYTNTNFLSSSITIFWYISVKGQVQGFKGPADTLQVLLQTPSTVQASAVL